MRFDRIERIAGLCCLLIALQVSAASAQAIVVRQVSGAVVELESEHALTWTTGMEGRLCTTETVGGQEVDYCPADIVLTRTEDTFAAARITGGDATRVAAGFRAEIDGLEPPTLIVVRSNVIGDTVFVDGERRGPTPQTIAAEPGVTYRVRVEKDQFEPWQGSVSVAAGQQREVWARLEQPLEGEALLAEANRLYDGGDCAAAEPLFRRFAGSDPDHASADYARNLAEVCATRGGAPTSQGPTGTSAEDRELALDLTEQAQRLITAGLTEEGLDLARQALAADPDNALAAQIVAELEEPATKEGSSIPVDIAVGAQAEGTWKIHITDVDLTLRSAEDGSTVASETIGDTDLGDWLRQRTLLAPRAGEYLLSVSFRSGQQIRGNWHWDENLKGYDPAAHSLERRVRVGDSGAQMTVLIQAKKKKLRQMGGFLPVPLMTVITLDIE